MSSKEYAMARGEALKKSEIRAAIFELNELCKDEYGIELEQLLIDKTRNSAKPTLWAEKCLK